MCRLARSATLGDGLRAAGLAVSEGLAAAQSKCMAEGGQDELHTKSVERVLRDSWSRLGVPSWTTWHSLRYVHTSRPDRPAQLRVRSL